MDDCSTEVRQALGRLMSILRHVEPSGLDELARAEFLAAREFAAKALLKLRARAGREWTGPAADSFYERWAAMLALELLDPSAAEGAIAASPALL